MVDRGYGGGRLSIPLSTCLPVYRVDSRHTTPQGSLYDEFNLQRSRVPVFFHRPRPPALGDPRPCSCTDFCCPYALPYTDAHTDYSCNSGALLETREAMPSNTTPVLLCVAVVDIGSGRDTILWPGYGQTA